MKHISNQEALDIAYHNLYNSKLKNIGKNLEILVKAKKNLEASKNKNK